MFISSDLFLEQRSRFRHQGTPINKEPAFVPFEADAVLVLLAVCEAQGNTVGKSHVHIPIQETVTQAIGGKRARALNLSGARMLIATTPLGNVQVMNTQQ